jgi:hypothetical protein
VGTSPPVLDTDAIARRLPLWKALSELFLDTKLDRADFQRIAEHVETSGFSAPDVHEILWDEVFPALGDNLRVPAGEWVDFEDHWLADRIVRVMTGAETGLGAHGLITKDQVRRIIADAWSSVTSYLPKEYRGK